MRKNSIKSRAAYALGMLFSLLPVMAFGQSGGVTIYGSIISSLEWVGESRAGLYSFNTADGAVFTPVKIEQGLYANGGGVYVDHEYYSVNTDDGMVYVYDADTWEMTASYETGIGAFDLAYDPTTGNIYGVFVDNGAKFGVFLPEEGSYQYIADFSMTLAALVCSNEGQLYGIGGDGLLYAINKETAEMSEIGDTGVYPMMVQSAAIDPNTGKCYWAATSFDATGLYEVDLSTGKASLVYAFPYEEEITGLFILEDVPADAPGKATDFQVDFANGSTTGSIRFVMPSVTQGGAALDGTLEYALLMNDVSKTGTGQPGETISLENITLETGDYKFVLTVSNGEGTGERVVARQWIGMDVPAAVADLKLGKLSETKVVLSWKAPQTGVHQGFLDTKALRYRIVRYPGNVVLYEDYAQTSFTEDIQASKLAQYWYVVTPMADGMEGEEASSNKVVMGPGYEMPYAEDFSTTTNFNLFTVVDGNADGSTWYQDIALGVAQYMSDAHEKADDWLVTPPLQLDEGGYYKLSFDVKCNSMDTHRIRVALGNLPEVESLTAELLPSQEVNTNFEWLRLEAKFRVPQSAAYYVGFHMESDAGAYSFDLDNVSVAQMASANAPAVVSNLQVNPGEKGALQATVSFNAPETTIKGDPLEGLTKIELYRGETLLEEFLEAMPGQALSFEDKEPLAGFNTYTVIAYNESGNGDDLSQQVYIGIDLPQAVGNITLDEPEYGVVKVAWEAPSAVGMNGGYVDSDDLVYTVKRNGYEEVASGIKELYFVDRIEGLGDAQKTVAYTIVASSAAGVGSEANSTHISVGVPYEMPFKESFPQGMASYTEWIYVPATGFSSWMPMYSMESQDSDNGLISLSSMEEAPSEMRLVSPKVRIGNTVKPVMDFYAYHSEIDDALEVEVFNAQMEPQVVATVDLKADAGGWSRHTVDLSEFKEQEYIQLAFVTRHVLRDQVLNIDNIQLADDLQHNLSASGIDAPARIKAGQTKEITVTVTNVGKEKAEGYSVDFYKGDEQIGTVDGAAVEPGQSVEVGLPFTPGIPDLDEVAIHAVVDDVADQNLQNNTTGTVIIEIEEPGYPKVGDLSAKGTGEAVELSWSAPGLSDLPPEASVEDFESYEPFTITDLGDWTMVDNDLSDYSMEFRTSANEWITYPNSGGAMSFQVIDLSQIIGTEKDGWDSMSGDKILISPYSSPMKDDWLVSPELYPVAQTVSLYAKSLNFGNYGLEEFTVLYSSTDKEIASFKELETVENVPAAWTEYRFQLPADAKYFAIHLSYTNSAIFFDDISYIPSTAVPQELAIEGYNVYRDGERMNAAPVADARYTDEAVEAGKEYVYAVTVVYDKGESGYSNEVKASSSTSISDAAAEKAVVYVVSGNICVVNPHCEPVAVYSMDGRILFAAQGKAAVKVSAGSGCYVVKVGDEVVKVLVP